MKLYNIFYTILADCTKNIFVYIGHCSTDYKLTKLKKEFFINRIIFIDLYRIVSRSVIVEKSINIFVLYIIAILYLLLKKTGHQFLSTVFLTFVYIFCEDIIVKKF